MSSRLKCLGHRVVTTAGTKIPLFPTSAPIPKVQSVKIRALHGNVGTVYVGDSTVSASGDIGDPLAKDQTVSYQGDNGRGGGSQYIVADGLYLDSTSNGDAVDVIYLEHT